ncbi:MAG: Long-chain-fatty-acid--CoA ligase FadD17 [Candidatus Lokiarchaeum sp. GC14_75]|nr:MAG: Long-chain-fatty-acid--CoA ligase FadD17 [Candidatus Lokiarchaeum sp. GC14_75]
MPPYIISQEEYEAIIKPSSEKKTPMIMKLVAKMAERTRDTNYSVGLRIEENTVLYPDKLALLYEDEKYTHKEYNAWINRYANYFLKIGLKKGDVAVVFVENRSEYMFVIAAMGKIGVISSLINTNLRKNPLIHSMTHTPGKVYIIGEELYQAFEDVKSKLGLSDRQKQNLFYLPDNGEQEIPRGYINLKEEIKDSDINNPPTTSEILMKDPFVYIFTSGTTGLPKAAIMKNSSIINAMGWWEMVIGLTNDDIIYITTPLFHSHGIKVAFAAALSKGSGMAIARKFSASKFWNEARKFNATCFNYVGEICRYLYNQPPKPDDADNPIEKIVGNGLRPDIWVDFKERFNIQEIREFYGATEDFVPNFANIHNLDKTCGVCLTPYAIVRYDIENDQPFRNERGRMKKVKKGEVGLCLGQITDPENFYMYKDKEATEKKVFRDVIRKGDMYINTGDLLRNIGFGHVQFVDRLGDTFRWKGENVSTEEVESVINTFEEIDMCSVYGVLIPHTEGRAGMVSVHKKSDEVFDFKGFLIYLKEYLPNYAIPKFLRFIDGFDFTATHKIQKANLKKVGYNVNELNDDIYVLLPGRSEYISVTNEIYQEVSEGKYSF